MYPNKHKLWLAFSTLLMVLGAQIAPALGDDSKAAKDRAEIDNESATALKDFVAMKGGQELFDKAAGYATFSVTKGGLGASGSGGGGVAVDKKSGARTYMRTGGAGVGFTFGVSKYDVIILFETPAKFEAFKKGGWDSAATAQAAAGTSGAEVSQNFFEGVAYFQIGRKGLMASADVSGTKFWVAEELNKP